MYTVHARSLALTLMLALPGGFATLHAQLQPIPHRSMEMLPVAREYAAGSFPSDAVLAIIGAVGNVEPTPGVRLAINADSGIASAWAYIYYSASQKRWSSIAIVDLPVLGTQVFETDPPTEIPPSLTRAIALDEPYSESGAVATRLMLDPEYLSYREQYPANRPGLVSYREAVVEDSAALTSTFPLDAPLWSIEFSGAGDQRMICRVSARTGETICRRASVATALDEWSSPIDAVVLPNPSSGRTTVLLPESCDARSRVELYDVDGRVVLSEARIESSDTGCQAIFDVSDTPTGMYFVRIDGAGPVGRIAVSR